MGIIKGFTFDGISSKDYNVGITGEAVYNAPTRDVEMITIPGRNGEFALDHGRFNNIEITYPAGVGDTAQPNFANKIRDLRNELASRVGYKRLEDEYNTNEYRLAIYKSGLEVNPVQYGRAGEFDIVFDCKPQRFLKSGENFRTVTRGDTLTNPTLFESQPVLEVVGYGNITINEDVVKIVSAPIGNYTIEGAWASDTESGSIAHTFDASQLNLNDDITLSDISAYVFYLDVSNSPNDITVATSTPYVEATASWGNYRGSTVAVAQVRFNPNWSYFNKGVADTVQADITLTTGDTTAVATVSLAYDGDDTLTYTVTSNDTETAFNWRFNGITGNSTKSALGLIYIDMEIGEAYKVDNGTIIPVNNAVTLPTSLLKLKPGANTVTFDNTINSLQIKPRWWRI